MTDDLESALLRDDKVGVLPWRLSHPSIDKGMEESKSLVANPVNRRGHGNHRLSLYPGTTFSGKGVLAIGVTDDQFPLAAFLAD
jgi:hypothetical protein